MSIDVDRELDWSKISSGGGTTGYPWSGYEIHESDAGDLVVTGEADVTGYKRHTKDGTRYICPMFYKTGTWVYEPGQPTESNLEYAYKHQFGVPQFDEDDPDTLRRQVIAGDFDGTWFDCIELN
jgi:hypothetical protein